jgi:small membrane protein
MLLIQYIIIAFAILIFVILFLRLKNRKISMSNFLWILILLIILAIFVLFPQVVFFLSTLFGIERAKDFMIYGAIAVLFILLFKAYLKIEMVERNLSKLVKEISLSQLK